MEEETESPRRKSPGPHVPQLCCYDTTHTNHVAVFSLNSHSKFLAPAHSSRTLSLPYQRWSLCSLPLAWEDLYDHLYRHNPTEARLCVWLPRPRPSRCELCLSRTHTGAQHHHGRNPALLNPLLDSPCEEVLRSVKSGAIWPGSWGHSSKQHHIVTAQEPLEPAPPS